MSDPVVAIVIPVYKQPSLLIEAVESALRQRTTFDYRIVLVNDGCPYAETDDVCRSYARAHPLKVRYIHRRNGGLSAARNAGVEATLRLWPSVEAIQMLDADDRLGPCALQKGFDALRSHPDAAWAHPDCRRFGFGGDYTDSSGPWSVLEVMHLNFVLCASMIRRSVFERGLRYDEQMRLGYEDWEFWIQCAEAGLSGVHVPEMEFLYRLRGESMLSATARDHEQVVGYMRRKHASLYTPRRAVELEQAQLPRYAIFLTDTRRMVFTTDPARCTESLSVEETINRLLRHTTHPHRARFPGYFVVTSEAFLRYAEASGFLSGLFWRLQTCIDQRAQKFAAARVEERSAVEYCLEMSPASELTDRWSDRMAVVMTSTGALNECLLSPDSGSWFRHGLDVNAHGLVKTIALRCSRPSPPADFPADALEALAGLFDAWGPAYREAPRYSLLRGKNAYRFADGSAELERLLFSAGALFPRLLDHSSRDIAYVLPMCEFGGAERVSMNFARETRRRGWRPHLFVLGSCRAQLLREFEGIFETVTVVEEEALCTSERLLGLLGTMDIVVNNLAAVVNPALGVLRRSGVSTFAHLHSVIITHEGTTTGQAYEAVRYEHCLDGMLVISKRLGRWCRAWGVPESKVIHAPNAPSFAVSEAMVRAVLAQRAERPAGEPLRVLFLGRFDLEKGLDRLAALYEQTRDAKPPLAWRVVGKCVCNADGFADQYLSPLRSVIAPPVLTAPALARLLGWADVMLMLSRYEGVPLSILEAQQLGCVVLSTDVGAIAEVVEHERTGFLFSNELDTPALVGEMAACLRDLQSNRDRLMQVSRAAAESRRRVQWRDTFEYFARAVESLRPVKEGHRT
ncbi:MAG TPA: glycosyltransferase [Phycisphaerae bacterium]|nr:glycosyltransferase [Phycisphaerae bacterium]